eukprot:2040170-Amphidinium_carterae.1
MLNCIGSHKCTVKEQIKIQVTSNSHPWVIEKAGLLSSGKFGGTLENNFYSSSALGVANSLFQTARSCVHWATQ